jgi:hypothetical protein
LMDSGAKSGKTSQRDRAETRFTVTLPHRGGVDLRDRSPTAAIPGTKWNISSHVRVCAPDRGFSCQSCCAHAGVMRGKYHPRAWLALNWTLTDDEHGAGCGSESSPGVGLEARTVDPGWPVNALSRHRSWRGRSGVGPILRGGRDPRCRRSRRCGALRRRPCAPYRR